MLYKKTLTSKMKKIDEEHYALNMVFFIKMIGGSSKAACSYEMISTCPLYSSTYLFSFKKKETESFFSLL